MLANASSPMTKTETSMAGPKLSDSNYRMSEANQALISDQFSELGDKVQALLKRAKDGERRVNAAKTREEAVRTDFNALPTAGTPVALFLEVEGLAFTVNDTERAILNAGKVSYLDAATDAEPSLSDRKAALKQLQLPFTDALNTLALQDEFVHFCEQCCMRRVSLTVCSRGFKPVVRNLLRSAGLGHVEVFANDVVVDSDGRWAPSFRDDSASGHDKARSVRRALTTAAGGASVVLIGSSECDLVRRASFLARRARGPPPSAPGRASCPRGASCEWELPFCAWPSVCWKGLQSNNNPQPTPEPGKECFYFASVRAPHAACAGFITGGARPYGLCQTGIQVCSRMRCRRLLRAAFPRVDGTRQGTSESVALSVRLRGTQMQVQPAVRASCRSSCARQALLTHRYFSFFEVVALNAIQKRTHAFPFPSPYRPPTSTRARETGDIGTASEI